MAIRFDFNFPKRKHFHFTTSQQMKENIQFTVWELFKTITDNEAIRYDQYKVF